jgi:hypothetical protein
VSLRWFFDIPPLPTLIRVHRSGTKKVPLGVNFTHYDNTQTAQHGRRVPDRNADATPPTRTHTDATRPTPLAPLRSHRARHTRPNPRLPLPRATHLHRPQHLATTPQALPTTALPRTDALSRPAAPRGGVVAPARSVPRLRRHHAGQPLDGAGTGRGGSPPHYSHRVEGRAGQHQRRVAAVVRSDACLVAWRVAEVYACICANRSGLVVA